MRNVVSKYDIDGIYFDTWFAFYFFKGKEKLCYCNGCKNGFRKASGKDIPFRKDEKYTPEEMKVIEEYRKWWKEEFFMVFNETRRIVKSYKNIPLVYNINNPVRIAGEDFRILQGSDAFLYERGRSMIERAEGVSLAVTHGLAVWPYVGTYDPYPRIPHFSNELGQEIYTSVAFGGSPILYHTYFFVEHPQARSIIKDAFSTFEKNENNIKDFKPYEYCAVIWNERDPPRHAVHGWLWQSNARLNSLGSFFACIRKHIQTTSMLLQDLDNFDLLSRYKVLVLPGICYLSDLQLSNIKRFVNNGGGLVMTGSTSLYNKDGEKLDDFALGSLAKIKYNKPDQELSEKISRFSNFGSVWDIYMKAVKGQQVIPQPLSGNLIPAHLYESVLALPGAKVVADIFAGSDNKPIVPGLIITEYGKGKVAYIASATGAMFQQTGIMEFADFFKDVIRYISPAKPPYEVEAPESALISNMTINGDRRVIHMITWLGSQNENMWQNVYYIPEIKNVVVKVRIPDGKKIKMITSFIPADLESKQENDMLSITIPSLNKYQGIVVEME